MDTGSKISRPLVFLPFTITASGLHNYISLRTAFIHGISSISSYYSATATLFIGSLMVYSSAFLSSTYSRIDSLHVSVIYEVSMSPANRINGYQLNLTNDVNEPWRPAYYACQMASNGPSAGTQSTHPYQSFVRARLQIHPQVAKLCSGDWRSRDNTAMHSFRSSDLVKNRCRYHHEPPRLPCLHSRPQRKCRLGDVFAGKLSVQLRQWQEYVYCDPGCSKIAARSRTQNSSRHCADHLLPWPKYWTLYPLFVSTTNRDKAIQAVHSINTTTVSSTPRHLRIPLLLPLRSLWQNYLNLCFSFNHTFVPVFECCSDSGLTCSFSRWPYACGTIHAWPACGASGRFYPSSTSIILRILSRNLFAINIHTNKLYASPDAPLVVLTWIIFS